MILFSSLHVGQLLSFERFSQSFSSKEAFSFTEKLPKIRSRYVCKQIDWPGHFSKLFLSMVQLLCGNF